MTRLQTSPTFVIGYANSLGRSDLPMIEKPIYKNSHGYFTKEDGEEIYLSEYELIDAEVNGLFTSLDEAKPVVPDGVILIFEDPDDILKNEHPIIRTLYCSYDDAQQLLGKIGLAYLESGFYFLNQDDYTSAMPLLQKSVRAQPNAVGLYVLLWACSNSVDDKNAERYYLYCIGERFRWLGGFEEKNSKKVVAGIDEIVIDLTGVQETKFSASNHSRNAGFSISGTPSSTSLTIMSKLNEFLLNNLKLAFIYDVAMAVNLLAVLYELPRKYKVIQLISFFPLKNKEYSLKLNWNDRDIHLCFKSLRKVIESSNDFDLIEMAGIVLGQVAKTVNTGYEVSDWNNRLNTKSSNDNAYKEARIQVAIASALVQITEGDPVRESLNRSYIVKAALRLGKRSILLENAMRIIQLAPIIENNIQEVANNKIKQNTMENIANAYRNCGHINLIEDDLDLASKSFDQGYQRFSKLILTIDIENSKSGYARIGEKRAYCALRLAQITRDKTLLKIANEQYKLTIEWLIDKNKTPSTYLYKCYEESQSSQGYSNDNLSEAKNLENRGKSRRGSYFAHHSDQVNAKIKKLRALLKKGSKTPGKILSEVKVIESYIEDSSMIASYYASLAGLKLEAMSMLNYEPSRMNKLILDLTSLASDDTYSIEHLAAHYERVGDTKSAAMWNNKLLDKPGRPDKVALMRKDKLDAINAKNFDEASRVIDRLIERARGEDVFEAKRLYFLAGEISSNSYYYWKTPSLEFAEEYYLKAVNSNRVEKPHPAAVQKLAWVQHRQGNKTQALVTLSNNMPIDDVRGSILFAQIAISAHIDNNSNHLEDAVKRVGAAIAVNPYISKMILCDLATELALIGNDGKALCRSLVAENDLSSAIVLKLYNLFSVRSWFDSEIITKTLERVSSMDVKSIEGPIIEFLHVAWLRSNIDDSNIDRSVFDNNIFSLINMSPVETPIKARALKVQEPEHSHCEEINDDYKEVREWYKNKLSRIPDNLKGKALNGVRKSAFDAWDLIDAQQIEGRKFPSVHREDSIVFIDKDLLSGMVDFYEESNQTLEISKDLNKGCINYKVKNPQPITDEESELLRYIAEDIHHGSFSKLGFSLPIRSS